MKIAICSRGFFWWGNFLTTGQDSFPIPWISLKGLGEGGGHSTPGGWQQTKMKRGGIFSKNGDIGVKFWEITLPESDLY